MVQTKDDKVGIQFSENYANCVPSVGIILPTATKVRNASGLKICYNYTPSKSVTTDRAIYSNGVIYSPDSSLFKYVLYSVQ